MIKSLLSQNQKQNNSLCRPPHFIAYSNGKPPLSIFSVYKFAAWLLESITKSKETSAPLFCFPIGSRIRFHPQSEPFRSVFPGLLCMSWHCLHPFSDMTLRSWQALGYRCCSGHCLWVSRLCHLPALPKPRHRLPFLHLFSLLHSGLSHMCIWSHHATSPLQIFPLGTCRPLLSGISKTSAV